MGLADEDLRHCTTPCFLHHFIATFRIEINNGVSPNASYAALDFVMTWPYTQGTYGKQFRPVMIVIGLPPPGAAVGSVFIADMHKRHGIPISGPGSVWTPYPESYGKGGQRFSFDRWRAFKGWCGHQHVPENTHGDPGALEWGVVESLVRKLAGQKPDTDSA